MSWRRGALDGVLCRRNGARDRKNRCFDQITSVDSCSDRLTSKEFDSLERIGYTILLLSLASDEVRLGLTSVSTEIRVTTQGIVEPDRQRANPVGGKGSAHRIKKRQ
jgi:hypothetical protein